MLIVLKYMPKLMKMSGLQIKVFGSLLLTQSILMNQRCEYSKIWEHYDGNTLIEAMLVGGLFLLGVLHLMRASHYIPK